MRGHTLCVVVTGAAGTISRQKNVHTGKKTEDHATLVPLLLFDRDLDSRTHAPLLRATVKVAHESDKLHERTVVLHPHAGGSVRRPLSDLEQDLAPSTRVAVEGALHRGQCHTDADFRAARQRDPRARREAPAPRRRRERITTWRLAPEVMC